jgi:hypothetical protein
MTSQSERSKQFAEADKSLTFFVHPNLLHIERVSVDKLHAAADVHGTLQVKRAAAVAHGHEVAHVHQIIPAHPIQSTTA